MSRFHIVVFNCERISLFLDNFDKIKNFDPEPDKLYIFDCSFNREQEQEKVANFLKKQGWEFNKQVHFIVRRNWGIDQGARIDLLQKKYVLCLKSCSSLGQTLNYWVDWHLLKLAQPARL